MAPDLASNPGGSRVEGTGKAHLKPDEAVLGYCKASSYSGPNGPGCAVGFSCSADGS